MILSYDTCAELFVCYSTWYLLVWVTTQEDNDNDNESESCDFSPPGTKCLWVTACCELKNTDRQRLAADVVQTAAALWDFFTLQQLQTRPQNQNQNLMDFITFHLNMIIVAALKSTYVSNSPDIKYPYHWVFGISAPLILLLDFSFSSFLACIDLWQSTSQSVLLALLNSDGEVLSKCSLNIFLPSCTSSCDVHHVTQRERRHSPIRIKIKTLILWPPSSGCVLSTTELLGTTTWHTPHPLPFRLYVINNRSWNDNMTRLSHDFWLHIKDPLLLWLSSLVSLLSAQPLSIQLLLCLSLS